MDELAQIMAEEPALPRIAPQGSRANIVEEKDKYTGIRQAGLESLRHFKRGDVQEHSSVRSPRAPTTSREPLVIPIREDKL